MTDAPEYKYIAFISYNSHDTAWGKRLQRKLENFRLPSTLCSEHGWPRKPLKPVFFAPTDIQPAGLSAELQKRLRASKYLIVICSPYSAQSEWVGREISYFYSLGRADNIHFFIVNGVPHSGDKATECFNPVVGQLGLPEILGANIHEKVYRWPWLNKERAYVQLISKLLGIEFDAIWQRHKRRLIETTIAWIAGAITVVALVLWVWMANRPTDVSMHLDEASVHNEALPPLCDAIVSLQLDNETKSDTLTSIDDPAFFTNIPAHYIGRDMRVTVSCPNFLAVDTTVTLRKDVRLNVYRDPDVYGRVNFAIWDIVAEKRVAGVSLKVDDYETVSDSSGRVTIIIPLERQKQAYKVTSSVGILTDSIHMPCGEDDVVLVK